MASASSSAKYDAFLSHNWGKDEEGRDNHARVVKASESLGAAGYAPWLDQELMRGNVHKTMAEAIEVSGCMIVFVTQQYINKASGNGPNGENDNCHYEFNCALLSTKIGVSKMIPVVMESACKTPGDWPAGAVKGALAPKLYVDLSSDAGFDEGIAQLIREIERVRTPGGAPSSTPAPPAPPASAPPAADFDSMRLWHGQHERHRLRIELEKAPREGAPPIELRHLPEHLPHMAGAAASP